ncbi:MAG TPA: hypothetical protein VHS33_07000 [Sphingomicrobium sp.]|jgi:hypothetical protein|nr:hypothetical protein [Sphingomicrobium sp.]
MRELLLIGVALSLLGCSGPVNPPGSDFAQTTAGRVAGPPQSCIPTDRSSGIRALDEQTLAYGGGRTLYINHLGGPCPGVRPLSTLIIEVHGNQYCRGDGVRAREMGSILAGPTCILGDWVPYRR